MNIINPTISSTDLTTIIFLIMAILNLGAIFFIAIPEIWKYRKQYAKYFASIIFFPLYAAVPIIRISMQCTGYSWSSWIGVYCSVYTLLYSIAWLIPWVPIITIVSILSIYLYRRQR